MRDELFDRDYQDGREAMNQGIDRLLNSIMNISRTLVSIQFAAPWKEQLGRTRRSAGLR